MHAWLEMDGCILYMFREKSENSSKTYVTYSQVEEKIVIKRRLNQCGIYARVSPTFSFLNFVYLKVPNSERVKVRPSSDVL